MTKDVMDAIKERRSVRRFLDRPVPEPTVSRVIEAAVQAPTAGNLQAWHFFIVTNAEKRQEVAAAAHNQLFIAQAPVDVVVCADLPRMANRYADRGVTLYALQDTAAAVENLMLAAVAFGLSTCWVGSFDEVAVAQAMGIDPSEMRPVAVIPLGYAAEQPMMRPRRPLTEVVTVLD